MKTALTAAYALVAARFSSQKEDNVDDLISVFTDTADRLDAVMDRCDARSAEIETRITELEQERNASDYEAQRAYNASRAIRGLFGSVSN